MFFFVVVVARAGRTLAPTDVSKYRKQITTRQDGGDGVNSKDPGHVEQWRHAAFFCTSSDFNPCDAVLYNNNNNNPSRITAIINQSTYHLGTALLRDRTRAIPAVCLDMARRSFGASVVSTADNRVQFQSPVVWQLLLSTIIILWEAGPCHRNAEWSSLAKRHPVYNFNTATLKSFFFLQIEKKNKLAVADPLVTFIPEKKASTVYSLEETECRTATKCKR